MTLMANRTGENQDFDNHFQETHAETNLDSLGELDLERFTNKDLAEVQNTVNKILQEKFGDN